MNTRLTRGTKTAVAFAVMIATSIGCGHQTTPTAPSPQTLAPPQTSSPPSRPSPVPTTNTVPATNNGDVGFSRSDVTMARSGMATVTLRWPNADFSLQLFVTSGVCVDTASLVTGGCTILGRTRPGSLPGVVTSPVTGGDSYAVWVLNSDPFPQDFRVDVDIE